MEEDLGEYSEVAGGDGGKVDGGVSVATVEWPVFGNGHGTA